MIKSAWLGARVLESNSELTKKKTSYHNNYHLSYQLNQSINQQSVYLVPSHPGSQRRAGLWTSWSRDCLGCSMWRGCRSSHSGRADDSGTVHELGDCGLWGSSQLFAVVYQELWAIAQHLKYHCNVEMSKSKDLNTSVKFFQILKQRGEEEEPCNAEVNL